MQKCPLANVILKQVTLMELQFGIVLIIIHDIILYPVFHRCFPRMLYIGVIELISAQVPFFMKGLVIGMTCCLSYVSSELWMVISLS
jgi:hypothetical protein